MACRSQSLDAQDVVNLFAGVQKLGISSRVSDVTASGTRTSPGDGDDFWRDGLGCARGLVHCCICVHRCVNFVGPAGGL